MPTTSPCGKSRYAVYDSIWNGVVVEAVVATLAAFAAMLALYRFRVIRATPRFRRVLIIAGVRMIARK